MGEPGNAYSDVGSPSRTPLVAVIGASTAASSVLDMARDVGRAIAQQGWHLLTGGGSGVMAAACQGFRENNAAGTSVGILPAEDAAGANPFVDVAIPTGLGLARNAIIARAASGLIAVGGCSGTLSEIALAWQMNRPIVAIAGSGGWAEKLAQQKVDDRRSDVVVEAHSATQAVGILEDCFKRQ
ncbi:MAG: TIGR00725 family protein [Myxococcota bacterium]|nr:TIGR00725 family protein [Myxococcota bacterium]